MENGLLGVLAISRHGGYMPTFHARWDHRENSINFDIEGVSNEVKKKFKFEKSGYRGHKTIRQDDGSYRFCIAIPSETIAKGTIRLIANYGLRVSDRMHNAG